MSLEQVPEKSQDNAPATQTTLAFLKYWRDILVVSPMADINITLPVVQAMDDAQDLIRQQQKTIERLRSEHD